MRRGNAMLLSGADADLLDENALRELCPYLDFENVTGNVKKHRKA